jgi:iron complex transport system substrate-binding protein
MRLAGLEQRPLPGGRAILETLLVRPPAVLVQSRYRSAQVSSGARWLDHPIVRNARAQRLTADGRRWTCMGPPMIAEIERLRGAAR